jgi:lipopolysaccharide export system protein LptA
MTGYLAMLRLGLVRAAMLTLSLAFAHGALAEGTSVAFGGLRADTTLPVEVKADNLTVNQADGLAVFSGNVLVTQGEMRLTANEIKVEYSADHKAIDKLHASGKVLIVNASDAAEADQAVYTIASGEVVMTGNVLLTQGQAAMAAEKLVINLKTGTGQMQGRVTTTFTPGKN